MVIRIKFKPGNTIFFLFNNNVMSDEVEHVVIKITVKGNEVIYHVPHPFRGALSRADTLEIQSHEAFTSKEQLLKAL